MVARGAISWAPSQPEGHSGRSGQDRGRDAVGNYEVSTQDSEFPESNKLLAENYMGLLRDCSSFDPTDQEFSVLSLGA